MRIRKPEGKKPLRRPKHIWEDKIRMDLKRNRLGSYGLDSSNSG
jgi:hypothetical protein